MKKYIIIRRAAFALLLLVTLFSAATTQAKDQFEMRINGAAALSLAEYWKATFSIESSFDEDGDKKQHYSDLGFLYTRIAEWLDIGANYRSVYNRLYDDIWINENRFYLNLIGRHQLFNIGLNHRVRLEYSQLDADRIDDFGTFRYRISINPPFEYDMTRERLILNDYTVSPYGSYEIALDTSDNEISSHTGKVGLSAILSEKVVANIYYSYAKRLSDFVDGDLHATALEFTLIF
jgi:hypothetical protein